MKEEGDGNMEEINEIRDQEKRKIRIVKEIDNTISELCKKVKDDDIAPELYPKNVKALAKLVSARALL